MWEEKKTSHKTAIIKYNGFEDEEEGVMNKKSSRREKWWNWKGRK
jgi:hypothetical protein